MWVDSNKHGGHAAGVNGVKIIKAVGYDEVNSVYHLKNIAFQAHMYEGGVAVKDGVVVVGLIDLFTIYSQLSMQIPSFLL